MRRALLALAATALSLAVPLPARALPVAGVVVVPAATPVQYTPFATVPGVSYLITVTGVYSPHLDAPNVDCGWRFDPVSGVRQRNTLVTVDGNAAGCQSLPYSDTHTYGWSVLGTGAPLRLSVNDTQPVALIGTGALTFVITGPRAEVPHDVSSFCFPHAAATPLLDYVPVVVETGAQAASTGAVAMSVFVVCDVTSTSGESLHLRQGVPGPVVETAGRMTVPPGDRLTVCSYAGATWDDGVEVVMPTTCHTVRV